MCIRDRPHIVDVTPITTVGKECASAAMVSVRADSSVDKRLALSVFATNIGTDDSEQWRVFVDRIERIQILTTFRGFFMDDVGIFKVQAFDSQDNHFSTLDGISFDWSVIAVQPKQTAALKKVPLSEIHDTTERITEEMLAMERRQLQPHMVALHGVITGKVTVECRISQSTFKSVPAASVHVHVTEALQLRPSQPAPLIVAPYAWFDFSLLAWRGRRQPTDNAASVKQRLGKPHVFEMPSAQYKWRSEQPTVLPVDRNFGRVVAAQLGHSVVHVEDQNLELNQQSAHMEVAEPFELRLHLERLNGQRWAEIRQPHKGGASAAQLLRGGWPGEDSVARMLQAHQYELSVFMFTESGGEMLITDNTQISFSTDQAFLESSAQLVTSVLLQGKQRGVTTVHAKLGKLLPPKCTDCPWAELYKAAQAQVATGEVVGSLKILIDDPVGVVPTCPIQLPAVDSYGHTLKLEGTGGSAQFKWSSQHQDGLAPAVTVTHSGLLSSDGVSNAPHADALVVTDASLPLNKAVCEVLVSPPVSLEVLATPSELPVGGNVLVQLKLRTADGQLYHNCSALPLRWLVSDNSILSNLSVPSQPAHGVCAQQWLRAERAGKVELSARFQAMQASSTVSVFRPMELLAPSSGSLLVALGSSADVEFTGGPFGGSDQLIAARASQVTLGARTADPGVFVWRVTCLELGKQVLTARITHPENSSAFYEKSVNWECGVPAALAVVPSYEPCVPATQPAATGSRHVLSHSSVAVRLLGYNQLGVKFDGTNSLQVVWSAKHNADGSPSSLTEGDQLIDSCNSLNRVARVRGDGEAITVTASSGTVKHVDGRILGLNGRPEAQKPLSASLELLPTAHPSIQPAQLIALCVDSNTVKLRVHGGSGSMALALEPEGVASHQIQYSSWTVELTPKVCGEQVTVVITDSLLYGSRPVSAVVKFSDVKRVEVEAPEQLEIGSSATAVLAVYGMDDEQFGASELAQMSISWESLDSKRLALTPGHEHKHRAGIVAVSQGNVYMHATVKSVQGEGPVSAKQQVRIFPKLELLPGTLQLLLGSSFQLQPSGGVRSGTHTQFKSSNSTSTTVSTSSSTEGVVFANALGQAVVTLTEASSSGAREALAQASSVVHVIALKEFRIATQSTKLLLGKEMSVYVEGPDGESPFMFSMGSADSFKWEVSDPSVLSLVSASSRDTPKSSGSFGVRLRGLAAGRAEVRVHIEWHKPCCGTRECQQADGSCLPQIQRFSTSATITVSDGLTLEMPSEITLPPNTKYPIQTNADESLLNYRVVGPEGVLAVDANGLISTLDTLGSCHVLLQSYSGDLSIVVTVHVRQMHQLMVVPPTLTASIPGLKQARNSKSVLPVGSSVLMQVVVADEVGNQFTSIGTEPLSFLRDRTDVLKVERVKGNPLQLRITAKSHGVVAMRVWINSRASVATVLDDFVRISVGNIVAPGSAIVCMGGSVAFGLTSAFQTNGTDRASWSVANTEIAAVDPGTGTATAKAPGSTLVHVSTNTIRSHALISVVRLGTASIQPAPRQPDLSDHDPNRAFVFNVGALDTNGLLLSPSESTHVKHNLKLQCSASGEGALFVDLSPSTDPSTGQLACKVRVGQIQHEAHQLELTIRAVLKDADGSDSASCSLKSTVHKGLQIRRGGVVLQTSVPMAMSAASELLEVQGLCPGEGLEVHSMSPSTLAVNPLSSSGPMHSFSIRKQPSNNRLYRNSFVTVSCPATAQLLRLEVQLLDDTEGAMDLLWFKAQLWLNEQQSLLTLLATALVVLVGLWFLGGTAPAGHTPAPAGMYRQQPTPPVQPQREPGRFEPTPGSLVRNTPPSVSRYDLRNSALQSGATAGASGQFGANDSPLQPLFSGGERQTRGPPGFSPRYT
eukprot:TRINITY_DN16106_c0_g1_i1.p1 TRINITY_DN16106_c0_g1~~TRINITY_DN16106_c0_g1_i1.p1  ORF type:complete len:1875 (-),score=657.89 TRINITY_DN16106_c0_g1_i1:194-5818(-)